MVTVNITINGQKIGAPAGSTVLRAAQAAGIDIPTLCNHPALEPIGACRVCLVEVKGQRVLQPACTFPISEGMEVQTETPAVVQSRKFVLDLLFSERNHYCMYCEMSGDCELQDLGYRYGLDHWIYPTYTKGFPVDGTRDYFVMDHNRCVLCRRCVRACDELVANHTLGLRERGAKTMIHADMNVPFGESSCVSCGTCLQVCPTGSLVDKRSAFMGRNALAERTRSTCSQCSVGCGIEIVVRGGGVLRLEGDWEAEPNAGLLCTKGRFEPLYDERERVTRPLVRRNGTLEAVSWDEALGAAAQRLGAAGSQVGVVTTTQATNEALFLVKQVFADGLGTKNVGLLGAAAAPVLEPAGTLADLADADLILVVGTNPVVDQPVASFLIKRAADGGVPLVVVDGEENGLIPFASRDVPPAEIAVAVELAARAQNPVVVYGTGVTVEMARALRQLGRAKFVVLEPGVNTRAAAALGLDNGFEAAAAEAVYVLLGEESAEGDAGKLPAPAFTVVQASYRSSLTEGADVVLPMAIWCERSGSLTNTEGRVLAARQAVDPEGEAKADWEILALLAGKLGKPAVGSLDELTAQAAQHVTR